MHFLEITSTNQYVWIYRPFPFFAIIVYAFYFECVKGSVSSPYQRDKTSWTSYLDVIVIKSLPFHSIVSVWGVSRAFQGFRGGLRDWWSQVDDSLDQNPLVGRILWFLFIIWKNPHPDRVSRFCAFLKKISILWTSLKGAFPSFEIFN